MPKKGPRSSSKLPADDTSGITEDGATAAQGEPAQQHAEQFIFTAQPAEEANPLKRTRIQVHRLPHKSCVLEHRKARARGETGRVIANAFRQLQLQQMPDFRPAKRPRLTWANLAHAYHDSCRDFGSNVVSMLKETAAGAKEVVIAAMAEVRAATVAGFNAAPAVAPAAANIVMGLCTVTTAAIAAPASVATLTGLAGVVSQGGIIPMLRSFFGL